jgi:hypothetical protein
LEEVQIANKRLGLGGLDGLYLCKFSTTVFLLIFLFMNYHEFKLWKKGTIRWRGRSTEIATGISSPCGEIGYKAIEKEDTDIGRGRLSASENSHA